MQILILGAGFGGLELATCLSEEVGEQVSVTLIDRSDGFVFGFSKLDVMFGKADPGGIRIPYSALAKRGVEFRQETILSIDSDSKRVETEKGTHEADVLVVALGADYDLGAIPGLVEFGHEFYSVAGAESLREVLATFDGGDVVIAVTTPHYKCPPAPSECAMLLHDFLLERGLRDKSTITFVSPHPSPLPVSPEVGSAILAELEDRNMTFMGSVTITGIEDRGRTVRFADGKSISADLILAVPLHVAPKVVIDSGLTENGWIQTDKHTLKTRFPDVFALGDVASVGVPRAGVFSEGQARIVARQLIARARGANHDSRYDGAGICYLEFGRGQVGKVDVDFFSGPAPRAELGPPTTELRAEKTKFGASRRARWFGLEM